MLSNQTTVFKNDRHFGGDVVLTTEVGYPETATYASVTVIVIPNDLDCYGGGAMVWDLTVNRKLCDTHTELLEELKKEEYIGFGSSIVEDIIGKPAEETLDGFEHHLHELVESHSSDELNELPDVTIQVGGRSFTRPLHADLYVNLLRIIDEEKEDE